MSFLPKQYQAQTVVAASAVEFGSDRLSFRGLPVKALAEFFRNGELLQKVMRAHGLDRPPYSLDLSRLLRDVVQVDTSRPAETIVILARLPSPELARIVANDIARQGAEDYAALIQYQYIEVQKHLKDQTGFLRGDLTAAEAALEEFEAVAQVEGLRRQAQVLLDLRADRSKRLAEMERELATLTERLAGAATRPAGGDNPFLEDALVHLRQGEEALEKFEVQAGLDSLAAQVQVMIETRSQRQRRQADLDALTASLAASVAELETKLQAEPRTVQLDRRLANDPAFQQALARVLGKPVQELGDLNLGESVLNPAHFAARGELIASQSRRAGAVEELKAIRQAQQDAEPALAALQEKLIGLQRRRRELTLTRDLAVQVVQNAVGEASRGVSPAERRSILLAEARGRQDVLTGDARSLRRAQQAEEATLSVLQVELARAERRQGELRFQRDMARTAAESAIRKLEETRLIPMLPPQLLSILPAAIPTEPVGPKRTRHAVLAGLGVLLALWAACGLLDARNDRRG